MHGRRAVREVDLSTILQPGSVLLAISTSIVGGISLEYSERRTWETAQGVAEQWETTRIVTDPAEHAEAVKRRSDASGALRKLCALTPFGPVCPGDRSAELSAASAEAREIVDRFNATSRTCRIRFSVLLGTIDASGSEAVRAVAEEVTRLVYDIAKYTEDANIDLIREVCNRAKQVEKLLKDGPEKEALSVAVDAARELATTKKKIEKRGADATDDLTLAALASQASAKLNGVRVMFEEIVTDCEVVLKRDAVAGVRVAWEDGEEE